MRYGRKKQCKTEKTMECAFMLKRMAYAQGRKNAKSKYTHKILEFTEFGSG